MCKTALDHFRFPAHRRATASGARRVTDEEGNTVVMIKCQFCKEEIQDGAIKCKHCGEILRREEYQQISKPNLPAFKAVSELLDYYNKAFQVIDSGQGKFAPIWN
jgi:hypothetical protein